MRRQCHASLAVTCFVALLAAGSGASGATKDCTVTVAEGETLPVLNDKEEVVMRLKAGDHIFIDWNYGPDWFLVSVFDGKDFKEVGHVRQGVDCVSPKDAAYPIVFDTAEQLYEATGLAADLDADAISPPPKKCFLYIPGGGGSLNVAVSDAFLKPYANYPFDNLCVVLKSGQVRFDPETGERVPTYFVRGDGFGTEFALRAPPCFAKGTFAQPKSFLGELKPLGCDVKFHPWSGRELGPEEAKAYTEKGYLIVSGEGEEVSPDNEDFAKDPAHRADQARIDALKALLAR
jgi:hypothetical protein